MTVEAAPPRTRVPAPAGTAAGARPAPAVAGAVAACALLAGALAVYQLNRRSFWQDEAFTWSTVDRPFPDLLRVLVTDEGYQILHSLLLWPVNLVSSRADVLRFPSAVAFAATVPAVWLAGRRLFDEATGVVAALLLALNAFALQYAQEARSNMLATCFTAWAGAFLAGHVLGDGGDGGIGVARGARAAAWDRRGWIVASALAVYAHGFAVFGIGAQVASLAFVPAARARSLRLVRSSVAIALLASPAIALPALQIGGSDISFLSEPGLEAVRGAVWFFSGRTVTAVPVYVAGIAVALAAAVAAARRSARSLDAWRFALPALWAFLPAALLMAASWITPVWIERYALWSLGGIVLLAAYGVTRLRAYGRHVMAAAVVLAALLALRGVVRWYDERNVEDYHSAMHELAARAEPGDALVFAPDEVRIPSEYYLRTLVDLDRLEPVHPPDGWGEFKTGDHEVRYPGRETVDRILDGDPPRRVWYVTYGDNARILPRLDQLRLAYAVVSHRAYRGPLDVYLLRVKPSAPEAGAEDFTR